MSLPDNCWTIRDGRKVIDRIPDDGNVESAVELLSYLRQNGIKIKYVECSVCAKCK